MTKRKLYSYVRWSSDRQSKGTSLERQTAKAKEFAHSHNLELVELLDAGLSAYRGKNTTQGALGGFIQAVESGAIPNDSYLFVENLDRLSRQDIRKRKGSAVLTLIWQEEPRSTAEDQRLC